MATLPYPGYLTPAQQTAQAKSIVGTSLDPALAEVRRQQAEADAAAAARAEQIQGATNAYAEISKGIAPQIQQTYSDAAHDQVTFAKGYSDTMRALQEKSGNEMNAQLQQIGAPEGQMARPSAGASDVLYGLGGVIPATTFGREGAAFTAAAAQLPATAQGVGMQFLMSAQAEAAKERKTFGEKLLELEAKRPGLIADTLREIKSSQQSSRSSYISEQYLLNTMRQTGASITGIDPATGQPTYTNAEAQADDAAKVAAAARTAKAKKATAKAAAVKDKTSAFTAAQKEMRVAIASDLIITEEDAQREERRRSCRATRRRRTTSGWSTESYCFVTRPRLAGGC